MLLPFFPERSTGSDNRDAEQYSNPRRKLAFNVFSFSISCGRANGAACVHAQEAPRGRHTTRQDLDRAPTINTGQVAFMRLRLDQIQQSGLMLNIKVGVWPSSNKRHGSLLGQRTCQLICAVVLRLNSLPT